MTLQLARTPRKLRVEVHDASARTPERHEACLMGVLGAGSASLTAMHSTRATSPVAVEAVTGIFFVLTFVLVAALGVALLRRPDTRLPAAMLVSIPALVALTAGLAATASDWAHHACAEAALYLGLAVLTAGNGPTGHSTRNHGLSAPVPLVAAHISWSSRPVPPAASRTRACDPG
ncbi:MAG: hypothetical protein M3P93_04445 [Actinomycetota bacterium]|nr:hypothetical protein [Actinomycetota bacterium]